MGSSHYRHNFPRSRVLLASVTVAAALVAARCGGGSSSTSPGTTSTPVSDFITGVSSGASSGQQVSGPLPTPNGGPGSAISGNASVIAGGSNVVTVTSPTPFQTVDLSIGSGTSGGSSALSVSSPQASSTASVDGFWQLRLPSPVTSVQLVYTLGANLPVADNGTFTTVYELVSAAGAVGSPSSQVLTKLKAGTGNLQVSVSWDAASDVDLHVVEPNNNEIYWETPTSSTTGRLDLDSNPDCTIDRKNNENITWTTAPAGTYTVRVDLFSSCNTTQTTFAVTVNNNGVATLFPGTFTGSGDFGGKGSGRTITSFFHAASGSSVDLVGLPAPLFTPSLQKAMRAAQGAQ